MRRAVTLMMVVAVGLLAYGYESQRKAGPSSTTNPRSVDDLPSLLAATPAELAQWDVARLNLACAAGLPGSEGLRVEECLATLDQWAERVRRETERNRRLWETNPEAYRNSPSVYRMVILGAVLTEGCGVGYNPQRLTAAGAFEPNEVFFADSRDVFLHGLLTGKRQGTCSSLPVLYVAVGRRLGYPLSLVPAKGHLFVRWEDGRERFNIECTSRGGVGIYDDDHYRRWPLPLSAEDEGRGYLRSLTGVEMFALFLNQRGHCLLASGRKEEGLAAHTDAVRMAPESTLGRMVLAAVRRELGRDDPFRTPGESAEMTDSPGVGSNSKPVLSRP